MLQPSFWDNRETADKLVGELKYIKNIITNVNVLSNSVNSALEMIDDSDDDVRLLLEEEINELKVKIDKLEIETYLNGKYDKNAAIMEIHAGAGGTESCDWAQMLYRMYSRYAEKNGYSITLLDRQDGEEAGIKSIMFQVDGTFAYGYLKGEKVYIDLLELVLLMPIREDILHLLRLMLYQKLIMILKLMLMIVILE